MNRNRNFIYIVIFLFLLVTSASSVSAQSMKMQFEGEGQFIESAESTWTDEEVEIVNEILGHTNNALDDAGLGGRNLLDVYRFRRYDGQFVDGKEGRIAIVRHESKEIVLGDAAFVRLQGFYIYHEIGHVIDKQLGRETNRRFHQLAGLPVKNGNQTADGLWLNDHARGDQEEATADAFALWVILNYTDNYRPVFAGTPPATDYELIIELFDNVIKGLA